MSLAPGGPPRPVARPAPVPFPGPVGLPGPPLLPGPPPATALLPQRLGAHLIDGLLLAVLTAPLLYVAGTLLQRRIATALAFIARRSAGALVTSGQDAAVDTARSGAELLLDGTLAFIGLTLLIQLVYRVLYEWVLYSVPGRSLGKMITGIRVVPVEWLHGDYRTVRPGLGRAALRTAVRTGLPGVAPVLFLFALVDRQPVLFVAAGLLAALAIVDLAFLTGVRNGRRTCLHDRASRTVVVPARWVRQVLRAQQPSRSGRDAQRRAVQRRAVQRPSIGAAPRPAMEPPAGLGPPRALEVPRVVLPHGPGMPPHPATAPTRQALLRRPPPHR